MSKRFFEIEVNLSLRGFASSSSERPQQRQYILSSARLSSTLTVFTIRNFFDFYFHCMLIWNDTFNSNRLLITTAAWPCDEQGIRQIIH